MKREDGYIRYAGDESPNLVFHDGGLRPAVGTWNVQVVRANRAHPECVEGVGNTYNHAPNIAWWQGKFYLAYLSNPVHEHWAPDRHSCAPRGRPALEQAAGTVSALSPGSFPGQRPPRRPV